MIFRRKNSSQKTIYLAWARSGGRCENCGKPLKKGNRGIKREDGWEVYHKDGNPRNNKLENCKILCWPCYEGMSGKKFKQPEPQPPKRKNIAKSPQPRPEQPPTKNILEP